MKQSISYPNAQDKIHAISLYLPVLRGALKATSEKW